MLVMELLRTTQFLRNVQTGNGVELSQLLGFRQTWEAQQVVLTALFNGQWSGGNIEAALHAHACNHRLSYSSNILRFVTT